MQRAWTTKACSEGITLRVHSSLNVVGLTAAVSRLAERGIPANVIAARYHDHIFTPRQSH